MHSHATMITSRSLSRVSLSVVLSAQVGLCDAPSFALCMVVIKLYPKMLAVGGWQLVMRVMQSFVVMGGLANFFAWRYEVTDPTLSPIV